MGLVTDTRWLNNRLLVTGSVGKLRDGIYGWYGEAQQDWGSDRLGLVGSSIGDDFSDANATQAFGYYEHEFGALGLTARLGYGTFLESRDQGVSLALERRYGESTVTTEAVRSNNGGHGLGVLISVPFGPTEASAPSDLRLRLAPSFREDYHSTPSAQGDYLQGDWDLRTFRGDLTAPYIATHADQVFGRPQQEPEQPTWPIGMSWEGTSGLMRIPTADVLPDGTMALGSAYIDRHHSKTDPRSSEEPVFFGLGFLPNVELVGRLTFLPDMRSPYWSNPYSLDRSYDVHWRVLRQSGSMPAVAIGAQDLEWGTGGTVIGRANYLVASWQQDDRWRLHAGAGTGRLSGIFGGAEYMLTGSRLDLMAEYDGKYVNLGARKYLGSWGSIDVGALGLSGLGGSIALHTPLK
jgi:hypothetical protein